jgi:phage virion morphogenesis protein
MLLVEIVGQERTQAIVKALTKALDQQEILDEGAAVLLARTRARFLRQVNPDEQPWLPSKAAIKRAIKGKGGGTLFDTGRLFHSIQLASSTTSERFIGTDVPYGRYHQYGKGQELRQFLGFSDADVSLVQKLVIKRIKDGIAGLS